MWLTRWGSLSPQLPNKGHHISSHLKGSPPAFLRPSDSKLKWLNSDECGWEVEGSLLSLSSWDEDFTPRMARPDTKAPSSLCQLTHRTGRTELRNKPKRPEATAPPSAQRSGSEILSRERSSPYERGVSFFSPKELTSFERECGENQAQWHSCRKHFLLN